jgi:transcriptional regulator with XRE-family HTH domain
MKNYFSSNLKYLREKNKMSKSKLGELVGVNQSTIGRWENNIITPSIDNVVNVLNAFKIPLTELGTFLGTDLKTNTSYNQTTEDYKKILREKGLMDENITEEDAKKLIDFAIANKDFIIKKNE